MTDLSHATIPQLWLRVWRIRLARWATRAARALPTSPNGSCPRICGAGFEPYLSPSAAGSLPPPNAPTVDVTAGRFCIVGRGNTSHRKGAHPRRRPRSLRKAIGFATFEIIARLVARRSALAHGVIRCCAPRPWM